MSRVGKKSIPLPKGVKVTVNEQHITVVGPKGQLERDLHPTMGITISEDSLQVEPKIEMEECKNFFGLTRSLVNNMVRGVSEGFEKSLVLNGVGYRAAIKDKELHLTLGYSHPVVFNVPKTVGITVDKQTVIVLTGVDKELVGQTAATIRAFRKPEPYHGKGVRYSDEVIVTKVGKAAGKK